MYENALLVCCGHGLKVFFCLVPQYSQKVIIKIGNDPYYPDFKESKLPIFLIIFGIPQALSTIDIAAFREENA